MCALGDSSGLKVVKSIKWAPETYPVKTADTCIVEEDRDPNPPMYLQDLDHSTLINCSNEPGVQGEMALCGKSTQIVYVKVHALYDSF